MKEPFVKFVAAQLGTGFLLIACGLPGTWKTETTEEVARITGYPLLRSDLIRLEVLKNEDVFDEKVASNMDKRMMVYEETFRRADEGLSEDSGVIIDATFVKQSLRNCRKFRNQTRFSSWSKRLPSWTPTFLRLRSISLNLRFSHTNEAR